MTSPANIQKPRRPSVLDLGGKNSFNNFASSFQRAQSYAGLDLLETAPPFSLPDAVSPKSQVMEPSQSDQESYFLPDSRATERQGYDHIDTYSFPHDTEQTPLVSNRRSSSNTLPNPASGNSTSAQTIFNSVNTLMGIAMFSLSFGFRLSGWIVGVAILVACAFTTNKTAKVLGAVLSRHPELLTYGDIAYLYGGKKVLLFATVTFTLDLLGASLSLILLFGDSFALLFPKIDKNIFKFIISGSAFFLSFLPLSVLSLVSLTGILSTVSILVLTIVCGFISPKNSIGSILTPASTSLWPRSALEVFLSIGIFMAPWGGHPVFPELYRDMKHSKKYTISCNITFAACFLLDLSIATAGYLMFGNDAKDSLTKNLMENDNLPSWVNPTFCLFLGLLPISKLSLVIRPMIVVYENYFKINDPSVIVFKNGTRIQPLTPLKVFARFLFVMFLFLMSLVFVSFGKVVAFLGSAICCTICITLPLLFYLEFFSHELSFSKRIIIWIGVIGGIAGAVLGTYAAFVLNVG